MDDIRPTSPEMDKADARDRDGYEAHLHAGDDDPDNWPVIFDSGSMFPKTFARIAQAASSLGVAWTIKQRGDLFQLEIAPLSDGFSQVSSSHSAHSTIDKAINTLASFLADAIDRKGAAVKWTAERFAVNPSVYSFRELRQATGYEISNDSTPDQVALAGPLLKEAVLYLRTHEFDGNQAKSEYFGICAECGGHAALVLPGAPAPRPGHNRGCKVALFLNKFDGYFV